MNSVEWNPVRGGTHLVDIRYSVESYGCGLCSSSSMIEWDSRYRKRSKGEQRQWEY
jgi:hypothetical protein